MKSFKIIIISIILSFVSFISKAQELNCQIQVVHQKITGANDELFRNMQRDIYEFMNNTHWTKHVYAPNERIECSILINIVQQPASDRFVGTIQVTSRRPVYNTSYNTSMLNYKEKENNFIFNYSEGAPLTYNPNSYSSLTTTLAFYANIILGIDYDSFGMQGGTEYFQTAQKLASLGQGSGDKGWTPYEDQKENNRYWLAEAFTNNAYTNIRKINYLYHRLGLDQMSENQSTARRLILDNIQTMKKTYNRKPNALIFKIFFTTKVDELVNIFKESQTSEKMLAYNSLVEMDIANQTKYQVLKSSN